MKQTRTWYHNQGLYLVISCINLLMLPWFCLFPLPLLIVPCISLLVGGVLLLISSLSCILLRKVGEEMEGEPSVPLNAGEGKILPYTSKAWK